MPRRAFFAPLASVAVAGFVVLDPLAFAFFLRGSAATATDATSCVEACGEYTASNSLPVISSSELEPSEKRGFLFFFGGGSVAAATTEVGGTGDVLEDVLEDVLHNFCYLFEWRDYTPVKDTFLYLDSFRDAHTNVKVCLAANFTRRVKSTCHHLCSEAPNILTFSFHLMS